MVEPLRPRARAESGLSPGGRAPDVSIVVPVYDEQDNLAELVCELRRVVEPDSRDYEILFVDDGSTDGSLERLGRLAADDPRIRVLALPAHGGQSAAMLAGFRRARAPIVVTLDADLQNDPADIPRLLSRIERCDVVAGRRETRQDGFLRRIASHVANAARRQVTGDTARDGGCTLRAYRAELLERLPAFDGMHRFLPALLAMGGARIEEVAVRHRPRRHGRSKYSIRNRFARTLLDLAGVWWMQRRFIDPRAREVRPAVPLAFPPPRPALPRIRRGAIAVAADRERGS